MHKLLTMLFITLFMLGLTACLPGETTEEYGEEQSMYKLGAGQPPVREDQTRDQGYSIDGAWINVDDHQRSPNIQKGPVDATREAPHDMNQEVAEHFEQLNETLDGTDGWRNVSYGIYNPQLSLEVEGRLHALTGINNVKVIAFDNDIIVGVVLEEDQPVVMQQMVELIREETEGARIHLFKSRSH